MVYVVKCFSIFLTWCAMASSIYAMGDDEMLSQKQLSLLQSRPFLSETEKQDIEELGKTYYLNPHRFRVAVTIEPALPDEMYPIGITFTRDQATPRTILLNDAASILPENIQRLPGHEGKRLPCNWYYPAGTHYLLTDQGWKEKKWVNLFEGEDPKISIQKLDSSYAQHMYPLAVIYGVDTPASPQDMISFLAANNTVYTLSLDPVLRSAPDQDYHISLKLENFEPISHQ